MIKNILSKSKKLVAASSVALLSTSAMAADNGIVGGSIGITAGNEDIIRKILKESPIVSVLVQAGILFGILFALFLMGKDMLTGQGDAGKAFWGKLGAMIAFGVLYYYLFMM